MTVHLTLPSNSTGPSPVAGPSSSSGKESLLSEAANEAGLRSVAVAIRSAKRIVFLTGAGVSVAAGIPDFRSSQGLFRTLGDESGGLVKDGKELFDVRALNSPTRAALHHRMLASLHQLAEKAEPTPFHLMLRELDEEGRLLRVYTQNIDNLEERAGLTQGIPVTPPKPPRATKKRKLNPVDASTLSTPALTPSSSSASTPSSSSSTPPLAIPTPRVIPLHGLLDNLVCPLCPHASPLSSHLPLLESGPTTIPCPECTEADLVRSIASLRSRGVGRMRAGVVLYGEEHPRGEDIGRVVERDLKGSRAKKGVGGVENEGKADLLVVVGTSLVVPGMRTLVKEFGRVVGGGKKRKGKGDLKKVKSVLINLTPLTGVPGTKVKGKGKAAEEDGEEAGGFDVFVQGDVQTFVTNYLNRVDLMRPPSSLPSPALTTITPSAEELVDWTTPERKPATWAYTHNLPTPSPWNTPVLNPVPNAPHSSNYQSSAQEGLVDNPESNAVAQGLVWDDGLVFAESPTQTQEGLVYPTPPRMKREAARDVSSEVESPSKKVRPGRPKNWAIIGQD